MDTTTVAQLVVVPATILVSTKAKVRYKFVQNSDDSRYNLLLHFKYQYYVLSVYIFYEKFYITLELHEVPICYPTTNNIKV